MRSSLLAIALLTVGCAPADSAQSYHLISGSGPPEKGPDAAAPGRPGEAGGAYGARKADGALPATTFLTTGSTAIGSTMN